MVSPPDWPAVSDFPSGAHAAELAKAKELFLQEINSAEDWEDQGERDGVQLYRKPDPDDPYAVPTVKGECVVEGVTTEEFLACIQLPGMRRRWDPRFEDGFMLARYSRLTYAFYSVMKGMGWLVYPRDILGVQQNFRSPEKNQEIIMLQTSIEDEELAPEQPGKTRATVAFSGWQLLPQGDDIKVTYIVKISLNGSLPYALVSMVATEIPLCTGRARDVYEALGHAPYSDPVPGETDSAVIWQTESISDPSGPTLADKGSLEYRCKFTSTPGATFNIHYDSKKMYADGIEVSIEGEGVEVKDDENGTVLVTCVGDTASNVTVVITPK